MTPPCHGAPVAGPRRAGAALALVALSLFVGGCTVNIDGRERSSAKVEQVLDSSSGTFDLTSPPSRGEAGMIAGQATVIYEHDDRTQPFRVAVALPDDKHIDTEATMISFDAYGAPDPATGDPTAMDIANQGLALGAARDRLLCIANQFDLPTEPIRDWYAAAQHRPDPSGSVVPETPWLRAEVGYMVVQVKGSYLTPDSPSAVVRYALNWEPRTRQRLQR